MKWVCHNLMATSLALVASVAVTRAQSPEYAPSTPSPAGTPTPPTPQAPEPATPRSPTPAPTAPASKLTRSDRLKAAQLQTLLARAGFSPGLIDGRPGNKTKTAIDDFQRARDLPINGAADEATLTALASASRATPSNPTPPTEIPWTRTYTITDADVALITGPIPTDWNERAALDRCGYADMLELLAERGWCSQDFVQLLNPGIDLNALSAGETVTLPDTQTKPLPRLARVEVDLSDKLVRGYDEQGTQVMLLHCSIAKSAEKRPIGELKVKVVATDPDYTFDPKDWPEVNNVTSKLRIPPGPRNPVGAAWVGLDKPGYGMHGTPRPQDIGKTGSHGCFRLANWDAVRLAKAVKIGTVVEVKE